MKLQHIETYWAEHKDVLLDSYNGEYGGINAIAYGFNLYFDENSDPYYELVLGSGGDGASRIRFYVHRKYPVLKNTEYRLFRDWEWHTLDISGDDFASDLWELLDECEVVASKWEALHNHD